MYLQGRVVGTHRRMQRRVSGPPAVPPLAPPLDPRPSFERRSYTSFRRTEIANRATLFRTWGTRLSKLIEGGRFSCTAKGISTTFFFSRWARITNSLANTSRSSMHRLAVSSRTSRLNALSPCVSVPR